MTESTTANIGIANFMKLFVSLIFCLVLSSCYHTSEAKKESTDDNFSLPDTLYAKVNFTQLKCGLYINELSDIAFRTIEVVHDSSTDRYLENYITRINGEGFEPDGCPAYMKNIVDTSTFEILNDYYFKDKNNIYFYTASSDGGTISTLPQADLKSFKVSVQKSELAKDEINYFQYGRIIGKDQSAAFKVDSFTWR